MAKVDGSTAVELVRKLSEVGIEGRAPGMKSSVELAEDFLGDAHFPHNDARLTSLIRWEVAKTAGSGFITGLGGVATLPVAVPAAIGAAWLVQAQMVEQSPISAGLNALVIKVVRWRSPRWRATRP